MKNTGQSDYTTQGEKQVDNPYLRLQILRHGAYLGYWIYIFTDGDKHYMHVQDAKSGEPIETKEVSPDTFTSFIYAKEYINDLLLLDSTWDVYGLDLMMGKSLAEILAEPKERDNLGLGKCSPAWQAIKDGKPLAHPY